MRDEVEALGRVAGLVVVPRHELDERVRERDARLGVEDPARKGIVVSPGRSPHTGRASGGLARSAGHR